MTAPRPPATPPDPELEALLDYLKRSRGFDFTAYKRSTLGRRIQRRAQEVRAASLADYSDYLEVHPEEYAALFDTILINVTSFFRDQEAWDYLAADLVPRLVERSGGNPIRVWSAGCSSGEEAYSIAILLAEALGEARFREQVKIFATDIDEDALAAGRSGAYPAKALENVPEEWREKYFEPQGTHSVFRNGLRRNLIFGRNDLTRDAPISRLDLLVCRNTLMYLTAEAQEAVLSRFWFALNDGGFLFLGKAEMLLSGARHFTLGHAKARVFVKEPQEAPIPVAHPPPPAAVTTGQLRDLAYDASPLPQLAVNLDGWVVAANDQAKAAFGLHGRDVGRPLRDLEISYRPVELRSRIEQAYSEKRPVLLRNVERTFPDGRSQFFDVAIQPVPPPPANPLGVSVTYTDVTRYNQLHSDLKRASEELSTAYEELQSANEELETSNEELQATVEELETTNEELQSANEELETMNEELQATNEELETTNEELRLRGDEAGLANTFLASILGSEAAAVIVLDPQQHVTLWNAAAEEMWGLRSGEVTGRPFFDLDFGLLPAEGLSEVVAACAHGRSDVREITLAATNRTGRSISAWVIATPLLDAQKFSGGVVLVMHASRDAGDA